jgi:hypothetical protein
MPNQSKEMINSTSAAIFVRKSQPEKNRKNTFMAK